MAFLARSHDILPAEMRTGIRNSLDIMSTVTIIALRRFRVPSCDTLPWLRVEISLRYSFMTPATLSHDFKLESCRIDAPDRMGRMAIIADGEWLICLADFLSMDARIELLLDAMVTTTACLGDVSWIDARE